MSRVLRRPGVLAWTGVVLAVVLTLPLIGVAFPSGESWIAVSAPIPLGARAGRPDSVPTRPDVPGAHRDFVRTRVDRVVEAAAASASGQVTAVVNVVDPTLERELLRVAGDDRYGTALDASQEAFPAADTVVIATGANWPDALGGSALAGATHAPLLLTRPDYLPGTVRAEIERLGATKVYILGGTAAVNATVENELVGMLGRAGVVRLGGSDRYGTARLVADESIRVLGGGYSGDALVATGSNFPDATAGAAVAAALGRPILLANAANGDVYLPSATRRVTILGGPMAVSENIEISLRYRLGAGNVVRAGGATRYETAVLIAGVGIAGGMSWDGVGIATGANFPDALAGGAMLGARGSVLLLTTPSQLSLETQAALAANAGAINTLHIFGGTAAVSAGVEDEIRQTTGIF